jgi:hypothetical protein
VVMPTQDGGDHPEEHEYLSNFFPIEGDTVIVCMGSWGLEMARKPEAFEASAGRVRASAFGAAMRACTPLSEVHLTRSTGNKWRRYDELANPPIGLVAIGDSICAFNPFYAQGMSSAARSALLLREKLEAGATIDADFHRDYLKAQKKSLDVPWMLAMARDQAYDCATGTETIAPWRRKLSSKVSWPIFNTINAASREDTYVEESFAAVFNLDKSLKQMVTDPRFWWGLARYRIRERLGRTVVPGGFDELKDPPGTDWTDPVKAAAECRTAELVES